MVAFNTSIQSSSLDPLWLSASAACCLNHCCQHLDQIRVWPPSLQVQFTLCYDTFHISCYDTVHGYVGILLLSSQLFLTHCS